MLRSKTLRAKVCKNPECRQRFTPAFSPTQLACSLDCALAYNAVLKAKKEAAAKRVEKRKDREKKLALKTIPDLIKEAQREFNRFIRARDQGKPCICCAQPLGNEGVGGAFDCGHYRSVGSASHLRFHELNAHGQRKACNRYGAGRAVDYRIGLIARIGLDAVEALEADNSPKKWTRDELIAIRDKYKRLAKELRAGQ